MAATTRRFKASCLRTGITLSTPHVPSTKLLRLFLSLLNYCSLCIVASIRGTFQVNDFVLKQHAFLTKDIIAEITLHFHMILATGYDTGAIFYNCVPSGDHACCAR